MSAIRKKRSHSPATKLVQLGTAVPQVVAHRVARMALAGPVLSARDRKEFTGMVAEKQLAFAQSWMAMWTEAARVQQQFMLSLLSGRAATINPVAQMTDAFHAVADKGLAPVHRKAVSNSKRLARTRLR